MQRSLGSRSDQAGLRRKRLSVVSLQTSSDPGLTHHHHRANSLLTLTGARRTQKARAPKGANRPPRFLSTCPSAARPPTLFATTDGQPEDPLAEAEARHARSAQYGVPHHTTVTPRVTESHGATLLTYSLPPLILREGGPPRLAKTKQPQKVERGTRHPRI